MPSLAGCSGIDLTTPQASSCTRTCAFQSRCPTWQSAGRLHSGEGKVQLLPLPSLPPLPLGTADLHTLFRTYWSSGIPNRDEQEVRGCWSTRPGFSRVPRGSPVEPASCRAVLQGPTPQPQPPPCNPNSSSFPSPEKAALPATWSCSSLSEINSSSSSMHSSNTSFSESL